MARLDKQFIGTDKGDNAPVAPLPIAIRGCACGTRDNFFPGIQNNMGSNPLGCPDLEYLILLVVDFSNARIRWKRSWIQSRHCRGGKKYYPAHE